MPIDLGLIIAAAVVLAATVVAHAAMLQADREATVLAVSSRTILDAWGPVMATTTDQWLDYTSRGK